MSIFGRFRSVLVGFMSLPRGSKNLQTDTLQSLETTNAPSNRPNTFFASNLRIAIKKQGGRATCARPPSSFHVARSAI
jgi:hypothetical protein